MEELMTNTKEIRIVSVSEKSTKDGRKFKTYKTVSKHGDLMDLKFVRTCLTIPEEPCVLIVKRADANVDTRKQYPVVWIKDVVEIRPLEKKESNIDEFI